ncbi:MAG: hypothetical protein ABSA30_14320, partial [Candidatus Aminicenantales bacterium]
MPADAPHPLEEVPPSGVSSLPATAPEIDGLPGEESGTEQEDSADGTQDIGESPGRRLASCYPGKEQMEERVVMKNLKLYVLALSAAAFCMGQAASAAFDEPGKVLFLESFESLTKQDGALHTQPSSFMPFGRRITGAVSGTAKLVDGKKGRALELSGDTRVLYSDFDAINLLGGEISCWVKMNFDPNAKTEENKTILRNQIFLNFMSSDGTQLELYSCLKDVSLAITNSERNMILAHGEPLLWNKGEWHQLRLTWGNSLDLWVDGVKKYSTPWDGLFGPLPVEKEKLRLYVGFRDPGALHSEFTMDELTVLGPRPGNLACRPRASLPLLEGEPKLDG